MLLYPANLPGIVNLLIFWLLPSILAFLCQLIFLHCLGYVLAWTISVYMVYYFSACVRASAAGEVRAPDNINDNPSLWQAIGQLVEVLLVFVLLLAPALFVYLYHQEATPLFWTCLGIGLFLLPMAALAVIQFDSLAGFNPLLWIGSIGATLLPYLGLLLLLSLLTVVLVLRLAILRERAGFDFLTQGPAIYLTMILSHLLGRFYCRFEKRLRW